MASSCPPRRAWRKRLLIALAIVAAGSVLLSGWVWWLIRDLPDAEAIRRYRPHRSTEVRDRQGQLLLSLGRNRNRLWCPLKGISPWLIKAVVTAEDDTFFQHEGFRAEEIRKAFVQNLKKRRYARGASTITQQLAKNAFLSREKTITRKVRELFMARRIENALPKWRILELYLNEVEWGVGLYGVETAARYTFGKPASDLDLSESALLAGMLPNPRYFNPFKRPEPAERKRRHVLDLMLHNRVISEAEHAAALASLPRLSSERNRSRFANRQTRPANCVDRTLTAYLERHIDPQHLYGSGARIRLELERGVQQMLVRRFGTGNQDMLLIARRNGHIRGFTCIGGTAWTDRPLPEPGAGPGAETTDAGSTDAEPPDAGFVADRPPDQAAGFQFERLDLDDFLIETLIAPAVGDVKARSKS